MERKNYFVLIFFLLLCLSLQANYNALIYDAFINNKMSQWQTTIDNMQIQKNKSKENTLSLINYQYGYIAWCISNKKNKEAEKYLTLAEKNTELLEEINFRPSYTKAYRAAFYGFRIGLTPYKAPFLGPKSIDNAKSAMQLDKNNPYGYMQYGNALYYMPAMFGGSKTEAMKYFKKAQVLMEVNKNSSKDWNYLNLLTIIAKGHSDLQEYKQAKGYYEKILSIAPNFTWVKETLYPEIIKKTNNEK